jgi:hypothetical protein
MGKLKAKFGGGKNKMATTELNYRFNIDLRTETPVFRMTGHPYRLHALCESGVITGEESTDMGTALGAMLVQAMRDRNPLEAGYKEENNYLLGTEIWRGTPKRIAAFFRDLHCRKEWTSLPKADAEAEAWHALQETPEWAATQLALLEKHGIIVPLTGEQVQEFQLAALNPLRPPSEGLKTQVLDGGSSFMNECKEGKEGKKEGMNGGSEGNGSQPKIKFHLTGETKTLLETGGIAADLIRYFDVMSGYAKALNNPYSGDPVGLANSFSRKPGFDERFQQWLKNHPQP